MQFAYSQNKTGRFAVPLDSIHRPCAQRILAGEVHEPNTLTFIESMMHEPRYEYGHIIHGGTYFGDALPALSKMVNRDNFVFAFEPSPVNFLAAQITVAINEYHGMQHNVLLHEAAIGNENGKTRMVISKDGLALGGGSYIDESTTSPLEVSILRLDDIVPYISKPISIMYLDVEKMEYPALLGAEKIIIRWHPIIIVEKQTDDFVRDYLGQHGYTCLYHEEGNSFYEWSDK